MRSSIVAESISIAIVPAQVSPAESAVGIVVLKTALGDLAYEREIRLESL
jgi:hypothetical protein